MLLGFLQHMNGQMEETERKEAPPDLFVAGFNAHSQLSTSINSDIRYFTPIEPYVNNARVLFTCWSSTKLLQDNHLIGLGFQKLKHRVEAKLAETLFDAFGDHTGMLGCIDTSGRLYLISEETGLVCGSTDSSPVLGHIALAGNGKVAITFKQAPSGRLCHILQFDTFADFFTWFQDPSNVQLDPEKQHFMMQGRPKQLIANTATFLVLMEGGEVYSWGDPRYQSLGRSIVGGEAVPAEKPGLVEALGGLRISKVASGGWMGAALSEDGALYIWGTGTPGTDQTIRPLRESGGAGNVVLVELPEAGAEPLDVTEVGVGDNHIAVVTEDQRLFVVGSNSNGQLGLGSDEAFFDGWTEVPTMHSRQHVVCGPKATFLFS